MSPRFIAAAAVFMAAAGQAQAGPCTDRILLMEKAVTTGDAGSAAPARVLPVQAAPGGAAPVDQSKELHRALEAAREADRRGDAEACNAALDEAQRYLKS